MILFERSVLVITLLVAVAIPLIFQAYWLRVCATALYFVVLACSWNLLLGYTGQLSFAHAAFAGIGAYTSGLLCKYVGMPPVAGVLLGGATLGELRQSMLAAEADVTGGASPRVIPFVDVRRFAVSHQQEQFSPFRLPEQVVARVTNGRAHAG